MLRRCQCSPSRIASRLPRRVIRPALRRTQLRHLPRQSRLLHLHHLVHLHLLRLQGKERAGRGRRTAHAWRALGCVPSCQRAFHTQRLAQQCDPGHSHRSFRLSLGVELDERECPTGSREVDATHSVLQGEDRLQGLWGGKGA